MMYKHTPMISALAQPSTYDCAAGLVHSLLCSSFASAVAPAGCSPFARHLSQCGQCAQNSLAPQSWYDQCVDVDAGINNVWYKSTSNTYYPCIINLWIINPILSFNSFYIIYV